MKTWAIVAAAVAVWLAPAAAVAGQCGRPVSDDTVPHAVDALQVLKGAVGSEDCAMQDCDVDSDCEVTASDALTTLRAAVGKWAPVGCHSDCAAEIACEDVAGPICNGICPPGQVCVATGAPPGDEHATICHIPPGNPDNAHTIVVGVAAVPAHLKHGDTLGPCDGESVATPMSRKSHDQWQPAGSDDGDKDGTGFDEDNDGNDNHEPPVSTTLPPTACVCQPTGSSTTTTTSTTSTTVTPPTSTTMPPTTTTMPPTTTTMPPTTTTMPPTTTTMPPTTTTMPPTTTTMPPTTTTMPPTTTTTTSTTTTTMRDAVAAGAAFYDEACATCHAAGAHDMTGFAGDLAGQGNNVISDLGSIDSAMSGLMLTDQQISDLMAFLNSL